MDKKSLKQIEELIEKQLKSQELRLEKKFATKDDLKAMESRIDTKFATKDDLKAMESRLEGTFATKKDLSNVTIELKKHIDQAFTDVFETADKTKADKIDLIRLERRINKLEQKVFSN